MCGITPFYVLAFAFGALAPQVADMAAARAQTPVTAGYAEPLDAATLKEIHGLYRKLIEAENRHDLAEVRTVAWNSPSALFVAKTSTPAEGNWTGFWGTDIVVEHLSDLYKAGPFTIDPDYDKAKVAGLNRDVTETYPPFKITVAYAGQIPVPKPFLMIIDWVRTPEGWRMVTDIALPIPPALPVSRP